MGPRGTRNRTCFTSHPYFRRLPKAAFHRVVRVRGNGTVAPQPAHHIRQDRATVFLAVEVQSPSIVYVVALLRQSLHQADILIEPVARLIVLPAPAHAAIVVTPVAAERPGSVSSRMPAPALGTHCRHERLKTKLPTLLSTLRKSLGRSQATMNAAMAPELEPPIPCCSGSLEML